MLASATIPRSLKALLDDFRPCFTAPSFATFCALVTGLIAQTRRRTVCGMLLGAGLERCWHHSHDEGLRDAVHIQGAAVGARGVDALIQNPGLRSVTVEVAQHERHASDRHAMGVRERLGHARHVPGREGARTVVVADTKRLTSRDPLCHPARVAKSS